MQERWSIRRPKDALGPSFVLLPLCLRSVLPDLLQSLSNVELVPDLCQLRIWFKKKKRGVKMKLNSKLHIESTEQRLCGLLGI